MSTLINRHLGLKPQAESCSPFGTNSDCLYGTKSRPLTTYETSFLALFLSLWSMWSGGAHNHREGSRPAAAGSVGKLCRPAAGGSRERPSVWNRSLMSRLRNYRWPVRPVTSSFGRRGQIRTPGSFPGAACCQPTELETYKRLPSRCLTTQDSVAIFP